MASSKNTSHERAMLEGLRHAVHGLRAPFACGGTLVPEQPVTIIDLYVYGALHVAIPPYGEGARAVTRAGPSRASSPVPRRTKKR